MENKVCRQCNAKFVVEDEDLRFFHQISPTLDGKTFDIPAPTLCPTCRHIRRLSFRNDYNIYKTKSSLSGKDMLSIYSPDKNLVVYSNDEWWSDSWNPLDYGIDYDQNRSFFAQFQELQARVPRLNLYVDNLCEGCDFSNQISRSKDCYLVSSTVDSERCMFGFRIISSKDTVDSLFAINCELCYECIDSNSCYDCQYIQESSNCRNSSFLFDCQGCSNCIMCQGLRNKSYYYKNKPVSEEEFKSITAKLESAGRARANESKKEFAEFRTGIPVKYARLINTEQVTGHNVKQGKKCQAVFDGENIENCSYGINVNDSKDCLDVNFAAANTSNHYEVMCTGVNANNILFSLDTWPYVSNLLYCDSCSNNTSDCFGCIGLRHKQYCILNKQYSKQEYEQKVAQIIDKMIEMGEWGEFFPSSMSPFGYNESTAYNYFPFSKEEAAGIKAKWQDNNFDPNYSGEYYQPLENIKDYNNPDEQEKLLSGIIKCEVSGRPFKILPKELAFYIENKIPIPTKHYIVRLQERFAMRTARMLHHRTCMNEGCQNEFETTYGPERPEKVYCEKCYLENID